MSPRRTLSQLALVTGVLLFSASLQTLAAFTAPTTAPPGADAYAPINTGSGAQSKAGGLLLNTGGAVNGLIVQNGNVGIGTSSPRQKLSVAGVIESAIGGIKFPDGTLQSTAVTAAASSTNIIVPISVGTGSTRTHEGTVVISSNQSLSGIHYYTDFTLNSGVTITVPSGKRRLIIIASGSITINGTINARGAGGAGGAGGGAPGYYDPGSPGAPGTDQPGGASGSAGGSVVVHGYDFGTSAQSGSDVLLLADPWTALGGAGGGGGGNDGNTGPSGAGGAGGGSIVLMAPTITLASTATLNSSGANGSTSPYVGAGTGGTGGGGNIYIMSHSYTNNGATFTQTGGVAGVKQILLY
ncbi:MAG: hypothetical protein NT108_02305 [Candidatus Kaiserbacteria bacterium]|nr:hypothetical protein [Candidatus Kaiserbacteria bacterium]